MTIFKIIGKSPRFVPMLAVGALLLGVTDIALAKNGGHSDNHNKMSFNKKPDHKDHKSADKHADKGKYKDKDNGEATNHPPKEKPPVVSKPPVEKPGPVTGGTPPRSNDPVVVRDHRPGGNASDAPPARVIYREAPVVRDHRNEASKPTPVVVPIGAGGGGR